MEGGCGIAERRDMVRVAKVHGERGYGAPGPGDMPRGG
jgi:hypothetical protein